MKPFVFVLLLAFMFCFMLCLEGVESTTFIVKNNCPYTIWPANVAGANSPQLSTTGFELGPGASYSFSVPASWSGRLWGRSFCSTASGKFRCETGDCGSGQVECNGAGGQSPTTLLEITLANGGSNQDFYDISLVDGFNLPISMRPSIGCNPTSCSANINSQYPNELTLKGSNGATIACKSACLAFNKPEFCCTGDHGTPGTCPPSSYSQFFKGLCPQAYSYAYDDKSSTFTCNGGADYTITFCP